MRKCLALILLVSTAGCGKVSLPASDAGADEDASPDVDAAPANLLDPIDGTWTFTLEDVTCTVTIDGAAEAYEVYCPSEPRSVGNDCTQTKDDVRLSGTWGEAFAGRADVISRYEGTTCQTDVMENPGVDIIEQGVFTMEAVLGEPLAATGFMQLAYGTWDWLIPDIDNTTFACSAIFGPAANEDGVSFHVECPEDPVTANNCTTTSVTVIDGVLTGSAMTGEGWSEDRNEGAGCSVPPVVEGTRSPMEATHM